MPTDEWANAPEASSQSSEAWDQQAPLIGVYSGSKSNVGPNNSMMHNVTVDTGEIIGVWGSTVLDDKFSEIPVGSRVRVEFLGKKPTKNGTTFKDYSVKFFAPEVQAGTDAPNVPAPLGGTPTDLPADVESELENKAV